MRKFIFFYLFLSFFTLWAQNPKYEFRAAWIVTVSNIDWPPRDVFNPEKQKKVFCGILDSLAAANFNCVIVQVRAAADAFYPSETEPWSAYLTGRQGKAPEPFYDPLAFMIEQAHKRGMEFHAWINPFRVTTGSGTAHLCAGHVFNTHRNLIVKYGGAYQLNPGEPEARWYIAKVVEEIVENYDIDAIHMDDYFYPYQVNGESFNDGQAYRKYKGDALNLADFRRRSVNQTVELIAEAIKRHKPQVKFGISPFGIWRNRRDDARGSDTNGVSNYDELYADVRLWLEEGIIDYVIPQLYWDRQNSIASYLTLLKWWGENSFGRALYIGHAMYKTDPKEPKAFTNKREIIEQVKLQRQNGTAQGSSFFSSRHLIKNVGHTMDSLKTHYYKTPAIIPPMPWLDDKKPLPPHYITAEALQNGVLLIFSGQKTMREGFAGTDKFVLYRRKKNDVSHGSGDIVAIVKNTGRQISFMDTGLPDEAGEYYYFLSSLSRGNNESEEKIWASVKY